MNRETNFVKNHSHSPLTSRVHSWSLKAFLHPSCSFAPNTFRCSIPTEHNVSRLISPTLPFPSRQIPFDLDLYITTMFRGATTPVPNPLHSTFGPHYPAETCSEVSTRLNNECEHSNRQPTLMSYCDGGPKLSHAHNTHLMILPSGLLMDGFLMEVVPTLGSAP